MLVGYDWSACLPRTGRTASQARWPSTQGFGKQFGTLIEYCNWLIRLTRRGGRAVDCTGLENRRPLTGFVSSNLTLSAKIGHSAATVDERETGRRSRKKIHSAAATFAVAATARCERRAPVFAHFWGASPTRARRARS